MMKKGDEIIIRKGTPQERTAKVIEVLGPNRIYANYILCEVRIPYPRTHKEVMENWPKYTLREAIVDPDECELKINP